MGTRARGFTLLELVVVLVILGLGASVAMPQLTRLVDGLDEQDRRVAVTTYLRRLPVEAMSAGEFSLARTDGFEPARRVLGESPLALPDEFGELSVWVQQPVTWHTNGACTGGALRWQFTTGQPFTTRLDAPRCKPATGS